MGQWNQALVFQNGTSAPIRSYLPVDFIGFASVDASLESAILQRLENEGVDVSNTQIRFIASDPSALGLSANVAETEIWGDGHVTGNLSIGGKLFIDDISVGNITASKISSTTFFGNVGAENITSGQLDLQRLPTAGYDASWISTGTLTADRLPVSGVNANSISVGVLSADRLPSQGVNANSITTGTISIERLPGSVFFANSLIDGTLSVSRLPTSGLNASTITVGTIADSLLPNAATNVGIFGSQAFIPQVTIDAKGRITSASNVPFTSSPWQETANALIYTGNVRVGGNLAVTGNFTMVDTDVQRTQQIAVENDGTGPALFVRQNGAQSVAEFWDDTTLALHVVDGGNVGVGVTVPVEKVDVNGNVQASWFRGNVSAMNVTSQTISITANAQAANIVATNGLYGATGSITGQMSTGSILTTANAQAANLVATSGVFGQTGSFSVSLTSGPYTCSGNSQCSNVVATSGIYGSTGAITGALTAGSVTCIGNSQGSNVIASSGLYGALGNITGNLQAANVVATAGIFGVSGSITGTLSAAAATFSGTVGVTDGVLATPAIRFSAETTTGVYRPASSNIGFVLGGTERMRLASDILTVSGDVAAFGSISDARLKTAIESIDDGIAIVTKLRPVSFRWRDDIFREDKRGVADVGFIAQEVAAVLPVATMPYRATDEREYVALRYERVIPYLTKAIQQQQQRIDALEEQLRAINI